MSRDRQPLDARLGHDRGKHIRVEQEVRLEQVDALFLERADERRGGRGVVDAHVDQRVVAGGAVDQRAGGVHVRAGQHAQPHRILEVHRILDRRAGVADRGDSGGQQIRAGEGLPVVVMVVHQPREQHATAPLDDRRAGRHIREGRVFAGSYFGDPSVPHEDRRRGNRLVARAVEQADVRDQQIVGGIPGDLEPGLEGDRCELAALQVQPLHPPPPEDEQPLAGGVECELLLIERAREQLLLPGLGHHELIDAVVRHHVRAARSVRAPRDGHLPLRRVRDLFERHLLQVEFVHVRAVEAPRLEEDPAPVRREGERPLVPVPGVRDLLRLAARERDPPHVRLVLRAVVHEEELVSVRMELHVPDGPRNVVQEADAPRRHVSHEDVRPLPGSRGVGEEAAIGRPGGARVPRGPVRELARRAALGGKRPDLSEDGDGDRRPVRRERGIPRPDVHGHVRLRLERSDAERQAGHDRGESGHPTPPSPGAVAVPRAHPGTSPFSSRYPFSSR